MNNGISRRITNLTQHATSERALVAHNRRIVASMVEDFVRVSSKPPEEARRFFLGLLTPDLAAHLADDWETNPLTLETLRIINQPDGHSLLHEQILERLAVAVGLEADELLQLFLLDSRFTFDQHMHILRIAQRRGLTFVMVNLNGPDLLEKAEAAAQRHAEIDQQARERLQAKGYSAEESEQIITQAGELRARFWDTEDLRSDGVCVNCGAANDAAAQVTRRLDEFLTAEGYSAEQRARALAVFTAAPGSHLAAMING